MVVERCGEMWGAVPMGARRVHAAQRRAIYSYVSVAEKARTELPDGDGRRAATIEGGLNGRACGADICGYVLRCAGLAG